MPLTTFGRMALRLIADGYQPIPVQPDTKVPAVSRWQQTPNVKMLSRWVTRYPNAGIGLVCGQIVAVDIDILDYEAAEQLDNLTTGLLRATPLVRVGRPPKRILVFRVLEPMPTRRVILSVGKLELLAEGSFFVGYGVHPDTGQPYQWLGESSPEFTPVDRIPIVTPLQCENLLEQALSLFPESQNFDEAPPFDGAGTAKRSNGSPIVRCPRTRKVIDGREAHLTHLVFDAWRENRYATALEIAGEAWSRFQETASLTRPAHDGKRPWCAQDAFRRAKALLRKERAGTIKRIAKSRGRLAPDGLTDLIEDECARFRVHVEDLHRRGRLSLAAWLVSEFMLTRLRGGRSVDTVEFIASRLNLPKQTIQRARRALLEKGLW